MISLLLLLGLLLNGDFSDGLNHWQANTGWDAASGRAVLALDNRAGSFTRGSLLCSDVYAVPQQNALKGAANVWANKTSRGYIFVGVRWYDNAQSPLWTEMIASNEGMANKQWHRITFSTPIPQEAGYVSFCFFAGAYGRRIYDARVDNATLQ